MENLFIEENCPWKLASSLPLCSFGRRKLLLRSKSIFIRLRINDPIFIQSGIIEIKGKNQASAHCLFNLVSLCFSQLRNSLPESIIKGEEATFFSTPFLYSSLTDLRNPSAWVGIVLSHTPLPTPAREQATGRCYAAPHTEWATTTARAR